MVKVDKLFYYLQNIFRQSIPGALYEKVLKGRLATAQNFDQVALLDRVQYYNKLDTFSPIGENATKLKDLRVFESPKTYNFDTYEYTRYFNKDLRANFLFGDITYVADHPSLQKSRPIGDHNANAVLLNLDKFRHFVFVKDKNSFNTKRNMLIGRSSIYLEHRRRFMRMYFDHPLCDLGQVNKDAENEKWVKPKMAISDHLNYKFILSLEGNDVATNLKWIMSSNSIAVMPKPKYETWFMEGRLIPDHHYIMIKDDYSDLEERLNYYIKNEKAAEAIIANAHKHVKQFLNKEREDVIALMVLNKYFYYTMQTDDSGISKQQS